MVPQHVESDTCIALRLADKRAQSRWIIAIIGFALTISLIFGGLVLRAVARDSGQEKQIIFNQEQITEIKVEFKEEVKDINKKLDEILKVVYTR